MRTWLAWRIDRMLAPKPNAKPIYFRWQTIGSTWPGHRVEAVRRSFDDRFWALRAEVASILGPPSRRLPEDRDWFNGWYPESIYAVAWERDGHVLCLAVERVGWDRAYGLVFRRFTIDEIHELLA